MKPQIPFPNYTSPLHTRIPLEKDTWNQRLERYKRQGKASMFLDSILSRLLRRLSIVRGQRKWAFYRIAIRFMRIYYKLFYRMKETGKEKIPSSGAIIYLNHIHSIDVVLSFIASFGKPVGVFTDMGAGFVTDMAEKIGFVPRLGKSQEMVEKMIVQILTKNKYFGIWPEGTPDKGYGIMQGFSGFIKTYSVLNHDKDRIPLMPALMVERIPRQKKKALKKHKKKRIWRRKNRTNKKIPALEIHYLEPFFLPRDWLLPEEKGGKTAREMADYAMMKLAEKTGLKELGKNPALERRKTTYDKPWE